MRVIEFRSENFKRLSVVQITPQGNVIQITGANDQGKTSLLDAIQAAIGAPLPERPVRKGQKQARTVIKLGDDNGVELIVERRMVDGKTPQLIVKGPEGGRYDSPTTMLKALWSNIGYDPVSFMGMKATEQYDLLRKLVKLDVDVDALKRQRQTAYDDRTLKGREVATAKGAVENLRVPSDLPETPSDVDGLTQQLADAGEHNARRERTKAGRAHAQDTLVVMETGLEELLQKVERQKSAIAELRANIEEFDTVPLPEPVDVASLTQRIADARRVADGMRLRDQKIAADGRATTLQREYDDLTTRIEGIDKTVSDAIANAQMPIEGLSFAEGAVLFNGQPLSQASAAQRLLVSAAIGAALNPKLRVLLIREGEKLDKKHMGVLAEFAAKNDLQVWIERVDESGEVGIIIEDGHVKGQEALVAEFEAGEAKAAKDPQKELVPDPERQRKARAYLDVKLAELETCEDVSAADLLDATVRNILQHFPAMIADEWTPAHAARVKVLK